MRTIDTKKYVTHECGENSIYETFKVIIRYNASGFAMVKNVRKCLKDYGFEINKYDPCIANKIANGKQCTICWHVDDTKRSHVDMNVVSVVINNIEKEFGTMTVTRGKEHLFVGMDFKLNEDGTVSISINNYIEECIASYGEEISNNNTKTPASSKLFNVNVDSIKLSEDKSEIFHHIVAKLLFVMKRVRLDISTTIAFLSTRITKSTKVDWVKLKRLLEYLTILKI